MTGPGERAPRRYETTAGPLVASLGEVATCAACAGEESRLFRPGSPEDRPQLRTPEDAAALLVPRLVGLDREHCLLASLDQRHRLVAVTTVSIGSHDHTFMSPREVFRDALTHGASAIVVAHNHPSADPEPSEDDQLVTWRLSASARLLGIPLLDHLVVGGTRWVSLARRGVVDPDAVSEPRTK